MNQFDSLVQKLQSLKSSKQPVILPDFFLDHFVILDSFEDFTKNLEQLAQQGGGNLLGSEHLVRRGGNSANTAVALYTLGLDPTLIVNTDEQGARFLQSLVPSGFNLDHIHTSGRLSSTVSLEAEYQGRRVNLMVSDSGSAADFGFDNLSEQDLQVIEQSGLVCLLNLNHNRRAVELCKDLFTFVKDNSRALTFMDMGDPSSRPDFIEPLVKEVISRDLVDVLGMNENEAAWYAWAMDNGNIGWRDSVSRPEKWLELAEYVSRITGVRTDLHTPYFSATIEDEQIDAQPTFDAEARILCGAGDAWNAGAIFGLLQGLGNIDRLTFANAVAALYVSYGTTDHPTLSQVTGYLESYPPLSVVGTKLLKLH